MLVLPHATWSELGALCNANSGTHSPPLVVLGIPASCQTECCICLWPLVALARPIQTEWESERERCRPTVADIFGAVLQHRPALHHLGIRCHGVGCSVLQPHEEGERRVPKPHTRQPTHGTTNAPVCVATLVCENLWGDKHEHSHTQGDKVLQVNSGFFGTRWRCLNPQPPTPNPQPSTLNSKPLNPKHAGSGQHATHARRTSTPRVGLRMHPLL